MPKTAAIEHAARTSPKLSVFVSYSRSDMAFADRLVAALEARGFKCLIDRRDLEYGEKWQAVLRDFIRQADAIVFVVSPRSIGSQWCRWELVEVGRLAKRLVPIVREPVAHDLLPPEIGSVHLMEFDPAADFDARMVELEKVLLTDRAWILDHTRLSNRALKWDAAGRHRDGLLRGTELLEAEAWKTRSRSDRSVPHALVEAFISDSRAEATRAQRTRTRIATAVALAALALSGVALWQGVQANRNAELARQQEAEAVRNAVLARQSEEEARRQRDAADLQRGIAERNEQQAREQRNQALATQSIYLARVSREASSAGNPTLGALLAMSGLPDETSVHANERERPYVAAAESALAVNFDWLAGARNLADGLGPLLQVRCDGSGSTVAAALADGRIALLGAVGQDVIYTAARHGTPARILAFSPDSRLLLSIAGDDEAMLWNAASGERLATLPPQSGKLVAASFDTQGSQIVTISQDATARFWSLRGEAASTLTLQGRGPVASATFASGSAVVVTFRGTAGAVAYSARDDRFVDQLANGQETRLFDPITSTGRKLLDLQDVRDGDELGNLSGTAIDQSRRRLLVPDEMEIKDAGTRLRISQLRGPRARPKALDIDEQGATVVGISDDGRALVWDATTGYLIWSIAVRGEVIVDARFCGGPAMIATGSKTGSVRLWRRASQVDAGKLAVAAGSIDKAVFNAAGDRIATLSQSSMLEFWDAQTRRLTKRIQVIPGSLDGAADLVATIQKPDLTGGTARVWNMRTGQETSLSEANKTGPVVIGLDGQGDRIVLGRSHCCDGDVISLWDAQSGRKAGDLAGFADLNAATSARLSPDGRRLVTTQGYFGGPSGAFERGGGYQIWDLANNRIERKEDVGQPIVGSAFDSRTGRIFLATVKQRQAGLKPGRSPDVFHIATDDERLGVATPGHGGRVIAFSGNRAQVYETQSLELVAELAFPRRIVGLSTGAAPDAVVVLTEDGTLSDRPLFQSWKDLAAAARSRLARCLDTSERQTYGLGPEPPRWCITGPGAELERDPRNWASLWPFDTQAWRDWLAAADRARAAGNSSPPLPILDGAK